METPEHIARKRERLEEWGVENVASEDIEGIINEIYWQANHYGFVKETDIRSIAGDIYARKLAKKTPPSDG